MLPSVDGKRKTNVTGLAENVTNVEGVFRAFHPLVSACGLNVENLKKRSGGP